MKAAGRTKRSLYMEWAKRHSHARFTLATSGVTGVTMDEFPLDAKEVQVTSPGGYGYAPLQERLARHNRVPVECVVAATGTSMANHLAMAAVLDPGDEVVIEEPVYGPMLDVAEYLGARVKRVPRRVENNFALEPGVYEKTVTRDTRLIVLSNLHNPSGALAPSATMRAIGEIAHRVGAHVLVDEVYLEVLFDGGAPFCFPIGQAIASTEKNPFIVTSSLTKVYGLSGLRCGWILAAPDLAQRIWLLNDLYGAVAAHPAERMSVMALDHLQKFRERARALLTRNRALVDAFLDSRNDLECFLAAGGDGCIPTPKTGQSGFVFQAAAGKV